MRLQSADSNNIFYYKFNNKEEKIIFPTGSYEIEDVSRYLQRHLKPIHQKNPLPSSSSSYYEELSQNAIILEGNHSTFKTEILCRFEIDFSKPNNIGSLLGFSEKVCKPFLRHESDTIIKILQIESLNLECNLISNSFSNDQKSKIIHSVQIVEPPGYKIFDSPRNLLYLPLTTEELSYLEIRLVDQSGRLVDLRGEFTTVRLHIRKLL